MHRLPDGLGFEAGASFEPLAVAVHAVRRVEPQAGQVAVILGLGPISLQVAQVLLAADPEIDVVFEVTAAPALVPQAAGLARPRGTVMIVALYEESSSWDPTAIVHKELTVRGSTMVSPGDFRDAIELLNTGRVRIKPLITYRRSLDDAEDAFRTQLDPDGTVKVMVLND